MIYTIVLIAFIIFSIIVVIRNSFLQRKLNQKVQLDQQEIEKFENTLNTLKQAFSNIKTDILTATDEQNALNKNIAALTAQRDELINSLSSLEQQQKYAAELFYKQAQENAEKAFEQEIENIANDLERHRQEAQNIYLKILEESNEYYQTTIANKQKELNQLNITLNELQTIVDNAIAAKIREEEINNQSNFYKLQLSTADINEIQKLRTILPQFRNTELLNKLIYKMYYEKAYTDLVGRVIGSQKTSGIYKITNILDNKSYIGQSTDISERFRQHIKRGTGAETPTRNKLYTAMYEIGPENFTFELLEECPKDKLNEREQFWINYYQTKSWGYNMTKGGS